MNTHLNISSHNKIALGSALATIGALLMVLAPLLGWYSFPSPWAFLLGFVTGLLAGVGSAMAIKGLAERRHER
jgi:glucose uptake protein GlcU